MAVLFDSQRRSGSALFYRQATSNIIHSCSGALQVDEATLQAGSSKSAQGRLLTDADVAAIVLALQAAMLQVNVVQMNSANVLGQGTVDDKWRG
jgi:hypothetical protein